MEGWGGRSQVLSSEIFFRHKLKSRNCRFSFEGKVPSLSTENSRFKSSYAHIFFLSQCNVCPRTNDSEVMIIFAYPRVLHQAKISLKSLCHKLKSRNCRFSFQGKVPFLSTENNKLKSSHVYEAYAMCVKDKWQWGNDNVCIPKKAASSKNKPEVTLCVCVVSISNLCKTSNSFYNNLMILL